MKVIIPRRLFKNNSGFLPPPILLERAEQEKTLGKNKYLSMKLKSSPIYQNSPVYKKAVPYFKTGLVEQWFVFEKDLKEVFVGQNLTTGPSQYAMTHRLLQGNSLAQFNVKATALGNETNASFKSCIQAVSSTGVLKKGLQTQKWYMCHILRKPKEMKIRSY